MVDRTVVLDNATELLQAEEDIVKGLGPIVDDWLKIFHGPADFIKKENEWRKTNLKGKDKDPLYPDAEGHIEWDFSVLMRAMVDKGRWDHFVDTQRKRGLIIPNKQETFLDIKTLINLRDKSHAHRTLGEFTEHDYREFFSKGERVLRTLGAKPQAEKLRLGVRRDARHDEYALQVYQWYREHENRQKLAVIARAYYAKVPGVLDLPMVTRSDWLAERPIPLSEFDEQLKRNWVHNAPDASAPLLNFLGGEKFSNFIARMAPQVKQEDRFCYRLLDVDSTNKQLKLSFGPSRYRPFVNSCEALSYELGEWCFRNRSTFESKWPRADGADLPNRGEAQAIFNLQNRSGCPACSTVLFLINHPKGDYFYLQRRTSPELLDSPGGLHVVPSGQFQNDTYEDANHDRGFSVQRTVMRELAEELLGLKEVEEAIQTLDDFYDDPRVEPFVSGIREGAVRGYFLGLGLDPLPTKPGLLTALVIDASRLPAAALKFIDNWEGKSFPVPLKELKERSNDVRVIPDGATCLRLADRHLEFLLGK
jgi:hypothetical protein